MVHRMDEEGKTHNGGHQRVTARKIRVSASEDGLGILQQALGFVTKPYGGLIDTLFRDVEEVAQSAAFFS